MVRPVSATSAPVYWSVFPMRSVFALLWLLASAAALAGGHSHFAPFDGIQVHYESYGSGPVALVFIHGWTCDLTFWRAQEPVYTKHRSLLIDLPGHGESDKPEVAYPVEFFARGVEAAMRDAGVRNGVLIGHSLGAPIAYAFIRLFPQMVKSIVLVDGYVSRPTGSRAAIQAQKLRYEQRSRSLSGDAGAEEFAKEVDAMFSDRMPEAMRERIRATMLATPEHVRVAAVTSPSELPAPPPALSYDVPALAILAGSPVPARIEAMRKIFPRLRVERWPGYGHFLMLEDPVRFNRTLEGFLALHP